jgi:hypothetical protein
MKTPKSLALLTIASLVLLMFGGCAALNLSDQHVVDRTKMHAGVVWHGAPEDPKLASQPDSPLRSFERKFIHEKDIRLTPRELRLVGDVTIKLYLINERIACKWPGIEADKPVPCRKVAPTDFMPPHLVDEPLSTCQAHASASFGYMSFVGVYEKQFCVMAGIAERRLSETSDHATNINDDTLLVKALNLDGTDVGGGAAIVGGPRPQYHATPLRGADDKDGGT